MSKGLWFITGIIVGASAAYWYLNRKNTKKGSNDIVEDDNTFEETSFDELSEEFNEDYVEQEPDPEKQKKVSEYIDIAAKYNKKAAQEFSNRTGIGPYIINPEDYGNFEDYSEIRLIHFADDVLVDDAGDILTKEEIEESVGEDYADYFGLYDDNLIVIRNDDRCADYHIERDLRKSFEADEVNDTPPFIDRGEDD